MIFSELFIWYLNWKSLFLYVDGWQDTRKLANKLAFPSISRLNRSITFSVSLNFHIRKYMKIQFHSFKLRTFANFMQLKINLVVSPIRSYWKFFINCCKYLKKEEELWHFLCGLFIIGNVYIIHIETHTRIIWQAKIKYCRFEILIKAHYQLIRNISGIRRFS